MASFIFLLINMRPDASSRWRRRKFRFLPPCAAHVRQYFRREELGMKTGAVRIGVVGAGGFGLMALQHFTQLPQVQLVGMAGTHREAAFATARRFGVPDIEEVDRLLAREDVD